MAIPETPWTIVRVPKDEEPDTCIIGSDHCFFARIVGRPGFPAEGVAVLIVRAVNSHATLVAELKKQRCAQCRGLLGNPKPHDEPCSCDDARAALALAEDTTGKGG